MKAIQGSAIVLCAGLLLAQTGAAQSAGAAAAELYQKGLLDMKAGRYEAGCPAIAESVRLDRRPGALFTLAECEAGWGKLATAVSHYVDYLTWVARMNPAEQSQQEERRLVAERQKRELGPRVPRATLTLPNDAPEGVVVELDGLNLNRPALEIPLPVDPGTHRVVVRLKDGRRREQSFEIARGESQSIALVLPEASVERTNPAAPGSTKAVPAPPRPAPERQLGAPKQPVWTYVAFGVGAVGLVVGGVSGGLALAEKPTVDDNCEARVCNHDGKAAADRLQRFALVSTLGFGIGVVGIGVGSALLLTGGSSGSARRRTRVQPVLAASTKSAFAGVAGAW